MIEREATIAASMLPPGLLLHDAPQGSDGWHNARCGVCTASTFSTAISVMTQNRNGKYVGDPTDASDDLAAVLAIERVIEQPYRKYFDSAEMREGREEEPHARQAYEVRTGFMVQEMGLITDPDKVFGYSTDGMVFGQPGAIEVKTLVSPRRIAAFITNPRKLICEFIDQCRGGMWLCNLQWIDLVIWIPAMKGQGKELTIIRVPRVEGDIEALTDRLGRFIQRVDAMEILFRSYDPESLREIWVPRPSAPASLEAPWDPQATDKADRTSPVPSPATRSPAAPAVAFDLPDDIFAAA